jgi:hypothetical protein
VYTSLTKKIAQVEVVVEYFKVSLENFPEGTKTIKCFNRAYAKFEIKTGPFLIWHKDPIAELRRFDIWFFYCD